MKNYSGHFKIVHLWDFLTHARSCRSVAAPLSFSSLGHNLHYLSSSHGSRESKGLISTLSKEIHFAIKNHYKEQKPAETSRPRLVCPVSNKLWVLSSFATLLCFAIPCGALIRTEHIPESPTAAADCHLQLCWASQLQLTVLFLSLGHTSCLLLGFHELLSRQSDL